MKMSKREEIPQPEAKRKQAVWVKMPKREEMLQPETNKSSRWLRILRIAILTTHDKNNIDGYMSIYGLRRNVTMHAG